MEEKKYQVLGYDKDNDTYITLAETDDLALATMLADFLVPKLRLGHLKNDMGRLSWVDGEPLDWIEVWGYVKQDRIKTYY